MTKATKQSDIKRAWHLMDLSEKNLGRTATVIAKILMGKSKSYFVRNLDCGDYVVVINAKNVVVTGNKETQKKYFRYSGYPHGLKTATLGVLRDEKPREIIRHAVKGMLPQNKLRDRMLKRLFVFEGSEHTYGEKFQKASSK